MRFPGAGLCIVYATGRTRTVVRVYDAARTGEFEGVGGSRGRSEMRGQSSASQELEERIPIQIRKMEKELIQAIRAAMVAADGAPHHGLMVTAEIATDGRVPLTAES